MNIKELQKRAHEIAQSKGWGSPELLRAANMIRSNPIHQPLDSPEAAVLLAQLALIHSEVSEACEDVRVSRVYTVLEPDCKPVGMASELADVMIRCLQLAEYLGIDMGHEIQVKMDYNAKRSHKHGGKLI